MTKTVARVVCNGRYRVSCDDTKHYNPYIVYYEWYDKGNHSKKLVECADLASCMYYIADEIASHIRLTGHNFVY